MNEKVDFNFYIPTNIIFKCGAINSLPNLDEVKDKRCMLLKYPFFKRDNIIDRLNSNCTKLLIIDEFEENPGNGFAKKISQQVADNDIECIIAIGGGSTIDTAKAAKWLTRDIRKMEIHIVAVPTTAGTGSEVTPYAILTDDETHRKKILNDKSLFPTVALCDPELTTTMPHSVTVNTAIDTLSHAIEAYFSIKCQGFLKELAVSSCRLIKENLIEALEDNSINARENIMLAALQGGIVLARCGTVLVHALGYNLTKEYGYAHGYSNAMLLGSFVETMNKKVSLQAKTVMDIYDGDMTGFISKTGIPVKLNKGDISQESIDEWVDDAYNSYGRPNCISTIKRNDIKEIVNRIL